MVHAPNGRGRELGCTVVPTMQRETLESWKSYELRQICAYGSTPCRHMSLALSKSHSTSLCTQTLQFQVISQGRRQRDAPELAVPAFTVTHNILHLGLAPCRRLVELLSDEQSSTVFKLAVDFLVARLRAFRTRIAILLGQLADDGLEVVEHRPLSMRVAYASAVSAR